MGLRSRTSNRADRAHLPQPSGAHRRSTRIEPHRRTRSDGARQLIFLCSALPAHIARPIPHRSSQFSRPALFLPLIFSGHCFRLIPASGSFAASAFPVPPLHRWVPSHKAAARFGSSSPRFWVPQKMGQKKETFSCPTCVLTGIASGVVCSPPV
jgi:hypothetical protein